MGLRITRRSKQGLLSYLPFVKNIVSSSLSEGALQHAVMRFRVLELLCRVKSGGVMRTGQRPYDKHSKIPVPTTFRHGVVARADAGAESGSTLNRKQSRQTHRHPCVTASARGRSQEVSHSPDSRSSDVVIVSNHRRQIVIGMSKFCR